MGTLYKLNHLLSETHSSDEHIYLWDHLMLEGPLLPNTKRVCSKFPEEFLT